MLFVSNLMHIEHCFRLCIDPNYAAKHEEKHQPKMGAGTVIKTNQNQRYATNAVTGFFLRELCRRNKVRYDDSSPDAADETKDGVEINLPCQEFVVRNDMGCGSTIGPILAHGVGIRVVDVGIPQLSMHSIREQAAVKDLWSNFHLFKAFFAQADTLDKQLNSHSI